MEAVFGAQKTGVFSNNSTQITMYPSVNGTTPGLLRKPVMEQLKKHLRQDDWKNVMQVCIGHCNLGWLSDDCTVVS